MSSKTGVSKGASLWHTTFEESLVCYACPAVCREKCIYTRIFCFEAAGERSGVFEPMAKKLRARGRRGGAGILCSQLAPNPSS